MPAAAEEKSGADLAVDQLQLRQPHWGGRLCCNPIREVVARMPAIKGAAAGQQGRPSDRPLREVRGSAPATYG